MIIFDYETIFPNSKPDTIVVDGLMCIKPNKDCRCTQCGRLTRFINTFENKPFCSQKCYNKYTKNHKII